MAFTDAVYDGSAALDGVTARRIDRIEAIGGELAARAVIPITTADLSPVLAALKPAVLIDARMRKRHQPERQIGLAPLTIGVGPNFTAGETTDLIVETGRIVARDMRARFGIAQPRLAIAGLNPHAGEQGALGEEDLAIVQPAVQRLIADGIAARGPLSADSMFHKAARETYDVALAMYHDQALIPIKTLAFDHAVNVTLGLPFVRTSPDHGTAFDIAGTGRANPASLIAALQLAATLSSRHQSRPDALDVCSPRRQA